MAWSDDKLARIAVLMAGIPEDFPAARLNRVGCSAMGAIRASSTAIRLGEADAMVADGGEGMISIRYSTNIARWGLMLWYQELSNDSCDDGLADRNMELIIGMTAEHLVEKFDFSNECKDEFCYRIQIRAKKALEERRFEDEIVSV